MREKFLEELEELLKKHEIERMWGWDSGEVLFAFKDGGKDLSVSYNENPYDGEEKLKIWK